MIKKLFFTEIKYHWWIYMIGYATALFFLIMFLFTGKNITMYIITTMGIFHLILVATGLRFTKERRDRLISVLPVPIYSAAVARIIFVLFYQSCLMLLWAIFFLVHYSSMDVVIFWRLLTVSALIFSYVLLFNINSDLGHYQRARFRVWFWICLLVGLFIILIPIFIQVFSAEFSLQVKTNPIEFYTMFSGSLLGCLLTYLLAGILFVLSIRIFTRRSSYIS